MSPTPSTAAEAWRTLRPQLLHLGGTYPSAAIAALRADRAGFAPLLVAELAALAEDPSLAQEDPDYALHFHLIALLAEWREAGAWAPLLKLVKLDEDDELALFGHEGRELIAPALATLCLGPLGALRTLADSPEISPWIRNAALEAIAIRAAHGDAEPAAAVTALYAVAQGEAARQRGLPAAERDETVISAAAGLLANLAAAEHAEEIRRWCEADLIDASFYGGWPELSALLERDPADALVRYRDQHLGYIDDAEAFLSQWAMFQPELPEPGRLVIPLGGREPVVREAPKVGRNDPCPCGSGKKYKKCCGAG